jgi:threonyl-tRNA synthetase
LKRKAKIQKGIGRGYRRRHCNFLSVRELLTDLCRGPHVKSTGEVQFFKLLSVAEHIGEEILKRTAPKNIRYCFFTKKNLMTI